LVEEELKNNEIALVLCESPTNPSLKIIDLEEIAVLSKKYNTLFAVDNSMATFVSQKPLDLGADISFFYHKIYFWSRQCNCRSCGF
jgi:cystathionine beta-lyase